MTLLLDPDIRDWVVLPLFVIMVAAGLLRHYVGLLMHGAKQPVSYIHQRVQYTMRQGTRIRSGASHYLSTDSWHVHKLYYIQLLRDTADWCEAEQTKKGEEGTDPVSAMANNPMGMLKGNIAFMVQNMVMMQGIQHFFSGFILLKVPFPLTSGFKQMFQRGMESLVDLEPSYVSSASWYFLVMYGLRSFFQLAIGDPPLEQREQEILLENLGMKDAPNPGAPNTEALIKQLRTEAENMEIFLQSHQSEMDGVERRLLGSKYPKKKLDSSAEDDFLLSGQKKNKKQ